MSAARSPTRPRWTHIALPSSDLDRSVSWYERFTPLVLLERFEHPDVMSAWLSHEGQVDDPFVLVLVMFVREQGKPQPILTPFAHIGIEVPERKQVIDAAEEARKAGCLKWEPIELPAPIGFICTITDPDGNIIEISHHGDHPEHRECDRGLLFAAREAAPPRSNPSHPLLPRERRAISEMAT
jgi:lactoylglutathione lyase